MKFHPNPSKQEARSNHSLPHFHSSSQFGIICCDLSWLSQLASILSVSETGFCCCHLLLLLHSSSIVTTGWWSHFQFGPATVPKQNAKEAIQHFDDKQVLVLGIFYAILDTCFEKAESVANDTSKKKIKIFVPVSTTGGGGVAIIVQVRRRLLQQRKMEETKMERANCASDKCQKRHWDSLESSLGSLIGTFTVLGVQSKLS